MKVLYGFIGIICGFLVTVVAIAAFIIGFVSGDSFARDNRPNYRYTSYSNYHWKKEGEENA